MYLGIIGIILTGTLLHFLYEFSHHNRFVAIFAAVNESVWEHIKIAMTPTFIWAIILGFHYGWNAQLLVGLALCLSVIIVMIPALFYLYTAFTKKSILVLILFVFALPSFAQNSFSSILLIIITLCRPFVLSHQFFCSSSIL